MILFLNLSEASWSLYLELKGGPFIIQRHVHRRRISRFSNYVIIIRIKFFYISRYIRYVHLKKKKKISFWRGLDFHEKMPQFQFFDTCSCRDSSDNFYYPLDNEFLFLFLFLKGKA